MQQYLNNNLAMNPAYATPQNGANAVSINIFTPQAYGNTTANGALSAQPYYTNSIYGNTTGNNTVCAQPCYTNAIYPTNYYSMYGYPQQNYMPYPQNYNNMLGQALPQTNNLQDTQNTNNQNNTKETITTEKNTIVKEIDKKEKETKKIIPLTNEYIQSLENYMNNENPKIRLIGVKDLMKRFKEDESRKDHPSLLPLLNKALKDTSPTVRFLALTSLQLGYANGNDETVQLLKQLQSNNSEITGEESLLASEILLNMTAGEPQKVGK